MNDRTPRHRLRNRTEVINEQAMNKMLGRVLPGTPEKPDTTKSADVPRLDVCAFNSSI